MLKNYGEEKTVANRTDTIGIHLNFQFCIVNRFEDVMLLLGGPVFAIVESATYVGTVVPHNM